MPKLSPGLLNESVEPLVRDIQSYVDASGSYLGSFYDADWGGMPTQAVFNRICREAGKKVDPHWIVYEDTMRAVEFARKRNFEEIFFLEYEPHEELEEICRGAKRVGIFGHHKARDDIRKLCQRDSKFSYFNPRDYTQRVTEVYERGVPILYPFLRLAERRGIDVQLIGQLGLRGYGYKGLFDLCYPGVPGSGLDRIIEAVNLLVAHRIQNANYVVGVLTEANQPDNQKVRNMVNSCARQKLSESKSKTVGEAIMDSKIIGDVQVFPVRTDFERMRVFVADLDRARDKGGYRTSVCVQRVANSRAKVSIRTEAPVDVPTILEVAHERQVYRNFGGHEKSGGFITSSSNLRDVLAKFLETYFWATGQSITMEPEDFTFLLNGSHR